ncbi:indole-3-glycerol phosphate synthase TrpC [Campylobacter sp. RM16192]|uniref:indole-3-glycerol phosphate synthase TrpC n=1 Tax=Campylobacter sp. RM16192 TaxID=1660080 RepID=UPI0014529DE4|nr:indole-3-glycerol phosphate synthase TrpC [Campylobacter sp. RM16192]QCD52465.1 indole-3-glycerol phosphate synthase [Campylobacter sp. RM16192]
MILDQIIERTKEDLEQRKAKFPLEWLGRSLAYNPYAPRDVMSVLKSNENEPLKIIAEVKKASPSKGIIRSEFEPIFIAKNYEDGGANAISVLTEPHYFKGNLEFLTQIRRYTATPLLRKDFIIDKYQIVEALVYGADFILLIAKALSRVRLKELLEYAHHLGLEVLVETHDKEDIAKAIFAGANIIGINHRNLQTFEMDMSLCERLIPLLPHNKIIVAESGLFDHEQLVNLNKIGVDAFLIGEHFMRQDDIVKAVKTIKEG